MKIVNINEYGDEEMRKGLRRRIDEHEPELPDSLWDRIHHEMDQRETNRKKRALWWLSSVAVVILASGIVTYSLLNSDVPNTVAQSTGTVISAEKVSPTPAAPKNEVPVTANTPTAATEVTGAQTTPGNTAGGSNTPRPSGQNTTGGSTPSIVDETETGGTTETNTTPAVPSQQETAIPPVNNTGKAETDAATQNDEAATGEESQNTPGTTGAEKDKKDDAGDKKNDKTTKASTPFQRWMVGAVYGMNSTYRTVTDENLLFGYPGSKDRNKYEKAGLRGSVAFEISFFPVKNFFIRTGIGQYKAGEQVQYSIAQKKVILTPSIRDSVIVGDQYTLQNTYTFTQVPLEIGYSRTIAGKFSGFVAAGVAYNMVSSYTYNSFEPVRGGYFFELNRQNYTGMVQNHLMFTGNAGVLYNVAGNFYLSASFVYRKADQSMIRKEEGVIVKPYSYGGNVGLNYKF